MHVAQFWWTSRRRLAMAVQCLAFLGISQRTTAGDDAADAVLDQVKASLARIQTVEFDFHVTNRTFKVPLGSGYDNYSWDGHFVLGKDECFQQGYKETNSQKTILDSVDPDGTRRIHSRDSKSGVSAGSILPLHSPGTFLQDGPAIATFLPLIWFAYPVPNDGPALETRDGEFTLSFKRPDGSVVTDTIDRERGFLVTGRLLRSPYRGTGHGNEIRSVRTLEYIEVEDGIWFPVKGTYSQTLDGISTDERTIEIDRDSIQINREYDRSFFTISFPEGCRVVDLIARREFSVGTAQGEESAESILDQVNAMDGPISATHPTPVPGSLSAERPRTERYVLWSLAGIAVLGAAFSVHRRRRA